MARALRKSSYLKAPSLVQLGFPSSLVAARGMVGDPTSSIARMEVGMSVIHSSLFLLLFVALGHIKEIRAGLHLQARTRGGLHLKVGELLSLVSGSGTRGNFEFDADRMSGIEEPENTAAAAGGHLAGAHGEGSQGEETGAQQGVGAQHQEQKEALHQQEQ
eukprot:611290-Pelagomonas_calceolata.AAC.1